MFYTCIKCGSVYGEKINWCSVCYTDKSLVARPEPGLKTYFVRGERRGVVSLSDIRNREVKGRSVRGFEKLGLFPELWKGLIYGIAGSMKSRFCLRFSQAYFDTVLYVSAEEGFGDTMKTKLVLDEIISPHIFFSDAQQKWEMLEDIEKVAPGLLVIDSISATQEDCIDTSLDLAQLWVCHSNKDKTFKGDSSIGHCVDLVMRIEDGIITVEKNRFGLSNIQFSLDGKEIGL